ncbi:hypothetical protein ACED16_02530 [Enterobacter hormaechei]
MKENIYTTIKDGDYMQHGFKIKKDTLIKLANIFASGYLSYEHIAKLINKESFYKKKIEASDVKEIFHRLYLVCGIDESYLFPFLNITPNQAKAFETAHYLRDATASVLNIPHEYKEDIINGNWCMPIKVNDAVVSIDAGLLDKLTEHESVITPKKVEGHKNINSLPITSPETVCIDGELFDISSLSPIGKKKVKAILSGSLSSHETVNNIPKGGLYLYWKNRKDYNDWQEYIKTKLSKPSYETFCGYKDFVLEVLSTIGIDKAGDESDNWRLKFSYGEVRAIRYLVNECNIPYSYLMFFFNSSKITLSSIADGSIYEYVE